MEDMKINSKTDYERYRVNSGNGPHRILEMLQEEALKESDHNQISLRKRALKLGGRSNSSIIVTENLER